MTRSETVWFYAAAVVLGVCIGVIVYTWIYGR